MALSKRTKHVPTLADSAAVAQPKIWVDGQQRPRFDPVAFAAVSLAVAKTSLVPHMHDCAARLDHGAGQIALGQIKINLTWAGRATRFLPSAARVASWSRGLGQLVTDASAGLAPPVDDGKAIAYPNLIRPDLASRPDLAADPDMAAPPTQAKAAPHRLDLPPQYRHAAREETTLRSIRALMEDANPLPGSVASAKKPRQIVSDTAPTPGVGPSRLGQALWHGAAQGVAAVFVVFALPFGALKALQFHLDGGDLKDWP